MKNECLEITWDFSHGVLTASSFLAFDRHLLQYFLETHTWSITFDCIFLFILVPHLIASDDEAVMCRRRSDGF